MANVIRQKEMLIGTEAVRDALDAFEGQWFQVTDGVSPGPYVFRGGSWIIEKRSGATGDVIVEGSDSKVKFFNTTGVLIAQIGVDTAGNILVQAFGGSKDMTVDGGDINVNQTTVSGDVNLNLQIANATQAFLRYEQATNILLMESLANNGVTLIALNGTSGSVNVFSRDLSGGLDAVRFHGNGSMSIIDGITAPPTIAGRGQFYVDTSDGDLKFKFGDGTVKTIVTDT